MMKLFRVKEKGFSLVELMIVVAIIAILAAIAIPAFMQFAMKAKTSEATANLNAIRTCLVSYKAENDVFLVCAATPTAGGNDATPDAWPGAGVDGVDAFTSMGFVPDGDVRYKYQVDTSPNGGSAVVAGEFTGAFLIIATGNLDENATQGTYRVDSGLGGYPKPVWDKEY